MSRLLVVSCRLPSADAAGEPTGSLPSGDDFASALRPWFAGSDAVWVGWPGPDRAGSAGADGPPRPVGSRLVPVTLSAEQVDRFLYGFTNRLLWPLFHYLLDRVPVDAHGWGAYQEVNALFADAVVREYREGDRIWIHDLPLLLVPDLVRQRLPAAHIGFSLHVPFPSSEVFRTLPWRRRLLRGLFGADLIGFQTFSHLRHFLSSILHVENVEVDIDRVRVDGRIVRLGVYPMGVDATAISTASLALAKAPPEPSDADGRATALAIDRLDHAKGVPRRLEAFERLIADPELRERLRLLQVAVPFEAESEAHRRLQRDVEERVGRINGARSTMRYVPIHYVHQALGATEILSLYRSAQMMLVTPLRDGMSLVAKEFVAARADEDGVLVLSEFAGAAEELDGALMVNPYDVDGMAATVRRALAMPASERRERMVTLRRRVFAYDVHRWASRFLAALAAQRPPAVARAAQSSEALLDELARARQGSVRLLLDYDGTLVPFAHLPELAAPDRPLLELLERLAETEGVRVDLVSGRPRESLEEWFGHLPIGLWAEHGFWWRLDPSRPWAYGVDLPQGWLERVRPILDQFTLRTPGSLVEIKSASIAWHYRNAAPDFGARQAHELRLLLSAALSNQPFEVLEGKSVIEIRLRGVSKAVVARSLRTEGSTATVVAFGDDHTDEDLFRVLPAGSLTVGVGERPTRARFTVRDCVEVRKVLLAFLRMPRAAASTAMP